MADLARSFAPLLGADARLLILGSMPGQASLAAQQYYAHPRNAFWPIVGAWLGVDPAIDYGRRVAALTDRGVALWDVLATCSRPGSLDSAIDLDAAEPNAIAELLTAHPRIRRVLCNGAAAASLYRRYRFPAAPEIEVTRLPSTSPAHAGMPLAEKMRLWHEALSR